MTSVLVIGCGSIGERHIANLTSIGVNQLHIYDPNVQLQTQISKKYGTIPSSTLEKAFDKVPEKVLVCTPPNSHVEIARQAVNVGASVFLEKPISISSTGVDELIREARKADVPLTVGYNLRFHQGLRVLKSYLDDGFIGNIVAIHAEFGQHLPSWRPNQDYREGYFSKPELGGGVLLDLAHEIDYVSWLAGEIVSVYAVSGTKSDLEIDTEDIAILTMRTLSGVFASIRLDCIQRGYWRNCKIVGSKGSLLWDFNSGIKSVDENGFIKCLYKDMSEINDMYVEEMEHFMNPAQSGNFIPDSANNAKYVLNVVQAAKSSSNERIEVNLSAL